MRGRSFARKGFTLIELMVVLAILLILAALAGAGLVGYVRLARFERNEANARTVYQAAQTALTRLDAAGGLPDWLDQARAAGEQGVYQAAEGAAPAQDYAERVRVLWYDRDAPDTPAGQLVAQLLEPYAYDSALLDASIALEIDINTGRVFSAFYDSAAGSLRFGAGAQGAVDITDRSYEHRRSRSLVGYYSAEDLVNVVVLEKTALKIQGITLVNGETLTLNWSGNAEGRDVVYTATLQSESGAPLYDIVVPLAELEQDDEVQFQTGSTLAALTVYAYADGERAEQGSVYWFPLTYSAGNFTLTLDAMASAELLARCRGEARAADLQRTSLYSITRLAGLDTPQDFTVSMIARPAKEAADYYTESRPVTSAPANTLLADGAAVKDGALTGRIAQFRHLYNLRWLADACRSADLTLAAQTLDWTGGDVLVYQMPAGDSTRPWADRPGPAHVVAFPTVPELPENWVLDGGGRTLRGVQLRSESVWQAAGGTAPLDVGLFGCNRGTIRNLTLRDADVQVGLLFYQAVPGSAAQDAARAAAEQAAAQAAAEGRLLGAEELAELGRGAALAADAPGSLPLRGVGALCGYNAGTVQNTALRQSAGGTARVLAAARLPGEGAQAGIGGLIGVSAAAAADSVRGLAAEGSVTGLWLDDAPAAEQWTEQQRYVCAQQTWQAAGIGGVAGLLVLPGSGGVYSLGLQNAADVTGNACTGGVAGSIAGENAALQDLVNTGAVRASAGYDAAVSPLLGQFFGGVTGFAARVSLQNCRSEAAGSLAEIERQLAAGTAALQGDFVGGIAGYLAGGATLTDCAAGADNHVLGGSFVGGLAGAAPGGNIAGGQNAGCVFGRRYVGGIVSAVGAGSAVTGAQNSGLAAAAGPGAAYAGGIAGRVDAAWGEGGGEAVVRDCLVSQQDDANGTRAALLQAVGAGEADFVGGLAGYLGQDAGIAYTQEGGAGSRLAVLVLGRDFVGGAVGCQAAGANGLQDLAQISGRVQGRDAVGGLVGLDRQGGLPAVSLMFNLVSGRLCVGGAVGADLPQAAASSAGLSSGNALGFVQGEAAVGGLVGYHRAVADLPARSDEAEALRAALPALEAESGVLRDSAAVQTAPEQTVYKDYNNTFTVQAGGYAGGIVGAAAADGALVIDGAENSGLVAHRADSELLPRGVLLAGCLQAQGADESALPQGERGALLGGVIGLNPRGGLLLGCASAADISGSGSAGGGIAGVNLGAVQNCTVRHNLGNPQQRFVGGVVGINAAAPGSGRILYKNKNCSAGTVAESALAAGHTVTGGAYTGGVAGANLAGARLQSSVELPAASVAGRDYTGGAAGLNAGTIELGSVALAGVSGSDQVGGVAGLNAAGGAILAADVQAGVQVTGTSRVGGVAGHNAGTVGRAAAQAVASAANVRANSQYAGGIVGSNAGTVTRALGRAAGGSLVRATGRYAGGIAGYNEAGGTLEDCIAQGSVTALGGEAGGLTAVNDGEIRGGGVQSAGAVPAVTSAADAAGGAVAVNKGLIDRVQLDLEAFRLVSARAAAAGALAGRNAGTLQNCTVKAANGKDWDLSGLTAAELTAVGGAAGENSGTVQNTLAALRLTGADVLDRVRSLGGLAGVNTGTVRNSSVDAFTAGDGAYAAGARQPGDAFGGAVGRNAGTVQGCNVGGLAVRLAGNANFDASMDAAAKLESASHIGGVAGCNQGGAVIANSFVKGSANATGQVAASAGFVGGVAGSNAGRIENSGSSDVRALQSQIESWLAAGDDGVNDMTRALTGGQYADLYGTDPVIRDGSANHVYSTAQNGNDLLVALRGESGNAAAHRANGYLGGLTGYNADTGTLANCASGAWFVYGDNVAASAQVGGLIGQNESDGTLANLLNCAAVRRFVRGWRNTPDDQRNQTNDYANGVVGYVGGVTGNQQNRTGTAWRYENCINVGTVATSRDSYLGGVVGYWQDNGGTALRCFNYGALTVNARSGNSGVGTVGGVVGQIANPTNGVSINILSCQNHGSINADSSLTRANDCAGILGKVTTAARGDSLVINLIDCVNGKATIRANSLACGICGWLGGDNVGSTDLNIDRCRNYSLDLYGVTAGNAYAKEAGICGSREGGGAGGQTRITNCFTLYRRNSGSGDPSPIVFEDNGQTDHRAYVTGENNYLVDLSSVNDTYTYGLLELSTDFGRNIRWRYESNPGVEAPSAAAGGQRLFVGKNNSADAGDKPYFVVRLNDGVQATAITSRNYRIETANDTIVDENGRAAGSILFWFGETNGQSGPQQSDILDADVQTYYEQKLDAQSPQAPQNIAVQRSGPDTGAVYGRYLVTWGLDGAGGPPTHYTVEVFLEGQSTPILTDTAYETRYTFPAQESWCGQGFTVRVTAHNTGPDTRQAESAPAVFAQALPTPQLEVRLWNGTQYLVLTNADAYAQAMQGEENPGWQVNVSLLNGYTAAFTSNDYQSQAGSPQLPAAAGELCRAIPAGYTGGAATTLRADAVPADPAAGSWFRSEQLSRQVLVPKTYPEGRLNVNVRTQGHAVPELQVTAALQFTGGSGIAPVYRVLLTGVYRGADAPELADRRVTVAWQEITVRSGASVTFTDLPADLLSAYSDLRLTAVPAASGLGPVYTGREADWQEALAAQSGYEFYRTAQGGWAARLSAPWAAVQAGSYDSAVICDAALGWTILPAPTALAVSEPEFRQNRMYYTFTWQGEPGADYAYTLTGSDGADIDLSGAEYTAEGGRCSLTVCADGWTYGEVTLTVGRRGQAEGEIGAAAQATFAVRQRLPQPGQPVLTIADTSQHADLRYNVSWPAVQAPAGVLAGYELWAVPQDGQARLLATAAAATATVDLEEYAAQTVEFYLVALAAEGSGYERSPIGLTTALAVPERYAAPAVAAAELLYTPAADADGVPQPGQAALETLQNGLTVRLTLAEGADLNGNYLLTGYFFDTEAEARAAIAADAWPETPDYGGAGGTVMTAENGRLTLTLADLPADCAGRYLAVRLRAAPIAGVSSAWAAAPDVLALPQVRLAAPATALVTAAEALELELYRSLAQPLPDDTVTANVPLYAVEWQAVPLAEGYTLTWEGLAADGETPAAYTVTLATAPADILGEDGAVEVPAGSITAVTATLTLADGSTYAYALPAGADGRWDLTTAPVLGADGRPQTDETGAPVLQTAPLRLTGRYLTENGETMTYLWQTAPLLSAVQAEDGSLVYRLLLPDNAGRIGTLEQNLHESTARVTVTALGRAQTATLDSLPATQPVHAPAG